MKRVLSWVVPALLGLGVAGLDVGAAASQALTSNINNSVRTTTVAPPENVVATSTLNLVLLTCKVTVTWTAPPVAGIGGYEVRRVLVASGAELDPPSFTSDLFYVDNRTPLTLIGNAFQYQVRSVLAGTTWRSEWVTADSGVTVLCLSPLAGPSGFASAEAPQPAELPAEEPPPPTDEPELPIDVDTVPSTSIGPVTSVLDAVQPVGEPPATTVPTAETVPTVAPETTAPVATLPTTSLAVVAGN